MLRYLRLDGALQAHLRRHVAGKRNLQFVRLRRHRVEHVARHAGVDLQQVVPGFFCCTTASTATSLVGAVLPLKDGPDV